MILLKKVVTYVLLIFWTYPRICINVKISCWQCKEEWEPKPLYPRSAAKTDFDRGFEIRKCQSEHGEVISLKELEIEISVTGVFFYFISIALQLAI